MVRTLIACTFAVVMLLGISACTKKEEPKATPQAATQAKQAPAAEKAPEAAPAKKAPEGQPAQPAPQQDMPET